MLIDIVLVVLALLGNLALWVCLFNRIHSWNMSCSAVKRWERLLLFPAAGLPVLFAAWRIVSQPSGARVLDQFPIVLLIFFWAALAFFTGRWLWIQLTAPSASALLSNHTASLDLRSETTVPLVDGRFPRLAARLPGNQILNVQFHEKDLQIEGLPDELEGLTIAQLSDLHFTGKFTPEFFSRVIERCNQWQPDLAVITGDIVDKTRCLDWLEPTVGRVESRLGRFFVLGNHDKRIPDTADLRQRLTNLGWTDLGSRWQLFEVRGGQLLLAGNEMPWFGPEPDMQDAPPPSHQGGPTRLLLSHSPDQIFWARDHDFDLMLAGHTHGGQIRIPGIGTMVCPSRYGVRFAAGVYHLPPTVTQVSRGLSGVHPLRWNCPPEVTLIRLVAG